MKIKILLLLLISNWAANAQFPLENIHVNYRNVRFYTAGDQGSNTLPPRHTETNALLTQTNDIFYARGFSKQAAFLFQDGTEDTIYLGYSGGQTTKNGIAIAKWNSDFSERTYGKITSNKHANVSYFGMHEQDSSILLVANHVGDTLYYNPTNPSDYMLTPWSATYSAQTGIFLNMNLEPIKIVNFTKPYTSYPPQLTFARSKKGYIFKRGPYSAQSDTLFLSDTALTSPQPHAYGVYKYGAIDIEGNYLWQNTFVVGWQTDILSGNRIEVPVHLTVIRVQAGDTPRIYDTNNQQIYQLDNQDVGSHRSISYFFNLTEDGILSLWDSASVYYKKSNTVLGSGAIYTSTSVKVVVSPSDSFTMFRGVKYNNNTKGTHVRTTDFSSFDGTPALIKKDRYYYALEQLKLDEVDNGNFAYHKDSSLNAIFKSTSSTGSVSNILSKYDSNYDILWARAVNFEEDVVSMVSNEVRTIIFGKSFGQNQDIHPDAVGSPLAESKEATISVYDCRPIAYFRASKNKEYTITFENLSHMKVNYLWDFDDGTTSSSKNPIHTFPRDLNKWYDVRLITSNNCGKDTIVVPVYIDPENVAISEITYSPYLNVYPNPARVNQKLHIKTNIQNTPAITALSSLEGKTVYSTSVSTSATGEFEFGIPNVTPGTYILYTQIGSHRFTKRIVIQ